MDAQNYESTGPLERFPQGKLVAGVKQIQKALRAGRVECVYLARNADPNVTEPVQALCQEMGVAWHWVRLMSELGERCGIEVGAAAAALLKGS